MSNVNEGRRTERRCVMNLEKHNDSERIQRGERSERGEEGSNVVKVKGEKYHHH